MIDSQTSSMLVSSNDSCLPDDGIPVVVLSLEDTIQDLYIETESVHQSDGSTKTGALTVSKVDCVALQPLIRPSEDKILNQPAFSSVTVTKKSDNDMLGMGLRKVDGVIQVSFIKPGCLLSEAPFQVGDKLVSINNRDCTNIKSLPTVAKILAMTTGLLTVVVEHAEGDPMLVESMILKESPTSKTGLGVCSGSSSRLRVSSIHPVSPFSHSLLNTRDQILSINGRDCFYLQAREAAALIINATSKVTIIAKKGMDNAAVVAFRLGEGEESEGSSRTEVSPSLSRSVSSPSEPVVTESQSESESDMGSVPRVSSSLVPKRLYKSLAGAIRSRSSRWFSSPSRDRIYS